MGDIFQILKAAIWGVSVPLEPVTDEIFRELKNHRLSAIVAPIMPSLAMTDELQRKWKNLIIQQIVNYNQYVHEQESLPITVSYTVLKGLAASKYYPFPEYRKMGDIDILTKKKDFQTACEMLLANGYREMTQENEEDFGRHRSFVKNGIVIEVHVFFALLKDSKKARALDDILIMNMNDTHFLPDNPNGLVLLDHINQHLARGLGLRQIIDWMMFADKCLSDEKWPEFQAIAREVGLEKLAITITEICVLYLGLSERDWCAEADMDLCQELMEYILSCGDFGCKREGEIGEGVFSYAGSIRATFRLLQTRGRVNWEAAKKHVFLRPFAWFYQLCRYLYRGFGRDDAILKLKKEYATARKKNDLLDRLGVRKDSDR